MGDELTVDEGLIQEIRGNNGAAVTDEAERAVVANERLIDPTATPEKLRKFAFAVGCPCPTRTMTRETAIALRALVYPMFGNPIHFSPDGMEVGEARNHIVQQALDAGVEWLFFLDYDVAPPPNALIKLLSLKTPISAGVYNLKQVPSYPLIYVKGWNYAFEDYEVGDLIKADGVGMGCTLINMEVFRKIEAPWFKTVPGYSEKNPSAVLPHLTEDIYFCDKARAAGYDIIVDTSVQCQHVDWRTGISYHFVPNPNNPRTGTPGWSYRIGDHYVVETMADASHPMAKWAETAPPPPPNNDSIDLGSGSIPAPGFVGIDAFVDAHGVIKGDISNLSWYRKEHGQASRIRSSHSLEHMSHRDVPQVFRDWVKTLKPGGTMEVRVPDGESHIRAVLERIDNEEDVDPQCDWLNATIYGLQIGEGQEHKTLFTKRRLEQLALSHGLVDVSVERVEHEGNGADFPTTWELVLTGRRPGGEEETDG